MNVEDLENRLKDETKKIEKINQLEGKPNKQLNENDLYRIIKNSCDIIIIDYSEEQDLTNYTYAIYNPDLDAYVRDREYLGSLVQFIINNQIVSPNISSKNAVSNIEESIKFSKKKLPKANIPPKHLVKFRNCIYDLKSGKKYDFDDKEIKDYHFINKIRYPLVPLEDTDEAMLSIVKRVFKLWSKEDKEVEKLMKQMVYSYIEGDGRGVQIILKSEGGDGKSTFNRILQKISHSSLTHHMNLDDYNDDNSLNQIQPSTKLILGDDLQSNFKMTNKGLSRFKTLVDGGSINVSEKFMPNKLIQSNALKIQNTNTDIKFFENNDSIKDRVILIEWPHHNFRQNPVNDFNLDKLTGKRGKADIKFMESLISYVIHTTEYFEKFSVTDKMKSDFNEMLDSNDILVQFINELIDQNILYNSHLPSSFLYEYFKSWLQDVNPGTKPMKLSEFTKRFKSLIFNKGYTEIKRWRFKQLKNYQFKFNDFENLDFNRETKSTIFINPEMNIENKIDDIENDLKNLTYEELSDQYYEKVIRSYIQYLITEKPEDALLIFSKYQIHEISDLDYDVILIELDKYFKGEI